MECPYQLKSRRRQKMDLRPFGNEPFKFSKTSQHMPLASCISNCKVILWAQIGPRDNSLILLFIAPKKDSDMEFVPDVTYSFGSFYWSLSRTGPADTIYSPA